MAKYTCIELASATNFRPAAVYSRAVCGPEFPGILC